MTNFVEQMMKTAGFSQTDIPQYLNDYTYNFWLANEYPPFTAEKQLELVKLILCSDDIDELNQYYNEIRKCYVFNALSLPDEAGFKSSWTAENQDFTQALAQLTTELMKAGELDKEKVREVLENAR